MENLPSLIAVLPFAIPASMPVAREESAADETVVGQAENDRRDPAKDDAKHDAVDPDPDRCHRCDRK
jgi:hypothetical protein